MVYSRYLLSFVVVLITALGLFLGPDAVAADTEEDLDFNAMLLPVPQSAMLIDKNYFIWGGSMVRDEKGQCHLFYSRWPCKEGFNAWVSHSEVAHAVADQPLGPYKHVNVALPARGAQHWDGLSTFNPTVQKFGDKYYLYYTGDTIDEDSKEKLYWNHRNHQRIGVAVAEKLNGPWERFDTPVIDVSPDSTAPDALMTSNPSICQRPDGTYLMVYKSVGLQFERPFGGPVVHLAATSKSPTGPFVKHETHVFTAPGEKFPAEDPYIWMQDGRYWAIVKDMKGCFTKAGTSLALFKSDDGLQWELAANPLVSRLEVNWKGKGIQKLGRLERPQLWLDKGEPVVLFCAVKSDGKSYNVHIPLKSIKDRK